MSDENRSADVLVAFGIGLLVGAAGALLLAPAPGDETRRRLGKAGHRALDRAKEGADSAKTHAKEYTDTARSFVKDQAERVERAFEEGKQAYLRETARG